MTARPICQPLGLRLRASSPQWQTPAKLNIGRRIAARLSGVILGLSALAANSGAAESVAESPSFELDLRPPGFNEDAASSAESAFFQLDLRPPGVSEAESAWFSLDLADANDQSLEPADDYPVAHGGVLGEARLPFSLKLDFAATSFEAGQSYYAEVRMESDSTNLRPKLADGARKDAWRIEVDAAAKQLLLNDDTMVGLKKRRLEGSTAITWPESSQGFDDAWGLSQWPPARYRYVVYKEAIEGADEALVEGTFRLGQLKPRHSGSFATNPILLLHGLGATAQFFADAERMADEDPDNDFTGNTSLGGIMSASRPTYTLEVPNVDDLTENAKLLQNALQIIADSYGVTGVDVIGHGAGGVVTRYVQQHMLSENPNLVRRFVAMGTPFEGSVFSTFPSGGETELGYFSTPARLVANGLAGWEFSTGAVVGSIASQQLEDPQSNLDALWSNVSSEVVNDPDFLAVVGSKPFAVQMSPDELLNGMSRGASMRYLKTVLNLQADAMARDALTSRSDALVRWEDATRRSEPAPNTLKNLYVASNHSNYNSFENEDFSAMITAMLGFISTSDTASFSHNLYQTEPVIPDDERIRVTSGEQKIVQLRNQDGEAVRDAVVAVFEEGKDLATVVSTVSDANGEALMPSGLFVPESASGLVVIAVGYQRSFDASASTSAEVTIPDQIVLSPDSNYTGPRKTRVEINYGEVVTDSLAVTLSIFAENATEMSVGEVGDALNWVPFSGSVSYTFTGDAAGEKEIGVAFRSDDGTQGAMATDTILYLPDADGFGSLKISDHVGGASVIVNGDKLEKKTPITLSKVTPGPYTVSIFQSGVEYAETVQSTEVTAGQESEVLFRRSESTVQAAYVSWISQYFNEQERANPSLVGESADPDLDGLNNWKEFLALLDPTDPESRIRIYFTDDTRNFLRYGPIVSGVDYDVQYTEDYESWTSVAANLQQAEGDEVRVDLRGLPAGRHYRVVVNQQSSSE